MTMKKSLRTLLLVFIITLLLQTIAPATYTHAYASNEIYFTILHTNDTHSSAIPHSPAIDNLPNTDNPTIGGYARLASAIKQIRTQKQSTNEEVLLFSAGDIIGGTPFSWLVLKSIPFDILALHKLEYDVTVIGNHEFDYGPDVLADYLLAAGYPDAHTITPIIGTNTQAPTDHPLTQQGLYKNYHIITLKNGITIGLFSLLGENAISVSPNAGTVTFKDQVETAKQAVTYLKEQNVDLIIAINHSGDTEDKELAENVPDIDVIIGGHTHTTLHEPIIEGKTIIVQAGCYMEYLGVLELAFNPETNTLRIRNSGNNMPYLVKLDSSIPDDPEMAAFVNSYIDLLNDLVADATDNRFNNIMDVVAQADFSIKYTPEFQETPMGNFVADAVRIIASEKTGNRVDLAIQANGNIRGDIRPGSVSSSKNQISFYDMTSQISLGSGYDGNAGYPIVTFYLTGGEVRKVLEVAALLSKLMSNELFLQFSGVQYYYNPSDIVLFNIPFVNKPLPSTLAVKKAQLYTGAGIQTDNNNDYINLKRGDNTLYLIATDSNILSFLPLVGEMVPWLDIQPKDANGNVIPSSDFDKLAVLHNGKELKVWQAVVEYAASHQPDANGISVIPDYYETTSGRINTISTIPLITWIILALVILILLIILMIFLIKRRRRRTVKYTYIYPKNIK